MIAGLRQSPSAVRFRRNYHDARGEGWTVNHEKIQRLWRDESLRVPQPRRQKRLGSSTAPNTATADAPNRLWAVDFQNRAPAAIDLLIDESGRWRA